MKFYLTFLLLVISIFPSWFAGAAGSKVQIGTNGFLVINGEPHFVIGMYNAGRYEEMAKAGFSATHNYGVVTGDATNSVNPTDAHLKQLLDRNATNGMRMMVELPRKAVEKGKWEQVRHRIESFRNHPGLLCWGSEERVARGSTSLTNIEALYRLVHELDPNHPLVLGDTKDVIKKFKGDRRDFFPDPFMDVGIWWWYPIPLKDPDGNGLDKEKQKQMNPPSWLTTTISKKPLWIAIQAYEHKTPDGRYPTPDEYRCMAYLSIINDVKGLWFYTGSGQKDFAGKPAGLLNKPEAAHWDYVKTLAQELRQFSPIILAPKPGDRLTLTPSNAPVEFSLREKDHTLYLIAANKSESTQSVTFSGSALQNKKAAVLFEKHEANIANHSLADTFTPLEVHLYRLESATALK